MSSVDKLNQYFTSIGCDFPDIGLLQPADPFLDLTGEDLRRRIFFTTDNQGHELCLRPEFTVPVCLEHLRRGNGGTKYAYAGKVFRQRNDIAAEFTQAGFEQFADDTSDDECIKIAIEALNAVGLKDLSVTMGDQAIFVSLLDALDISKTIQNKLIRGFGDKQRLQATLEALSNASQSSLEGIDATLLASAQAGDLNKVTQLIQEKMLSDGLPLTGGRTDVAIAERLMEKLELAKSGLQSKQREMLEKFLALDVPLVEAPAAIEAFQSEYDITIKGAADTLQSHLTQLSSLDAQVRYQASFGRRLDYYTGFVFEIFRKGFDKAIVGGGRYDKLMTLLGAKQEIPAVGFAIWVDRLEEGA